MNKQKREKMMVDVEGVKTTLDFSKMTDKELVQEFGYWKETAKHRMKIFAEYYGTDLEDRTYKDWQVADINAQAACIEMNERGL